MTTGFFDKLFQKFSRKTRYAKMLSGRVPVYSQHGADIYASDIVQEAVNCIANEMKKLSPRHIRYDGRDVVPINDDLQAVLENPNPLMTTSEFIDKIVHLYKYNYNVFILPEYEKWTDALGVEHRELQALWPIQPTQVDLLQDSADEFFIKFYFSGGQSTTLRYADVIHWRNQFAMNEFMGGTASGQPDTRPLVRTLGLYEELLSGVAKALKASYAINGVIKVNSVVDIDEATAAARILEEQLDRNENGFIVQDLKGEIVPFERKGEIVDVDTLKFIDDKILRHIGVPLCILSGDYTKEQYEAFYQKTLEPMIVSLSQAFTKKLFTPRQMRRHTVKFYPKKLIFLSVDQALRMVEELAPSGELYSNEKREMFGLEPLPELVGKRYMSLNWIDADIAQAYQLGRLAENNNRDEEDENA